MVAVYSRKCLPVKMCINIATRPPDVSLVYSKNIHLAYVQLAGFGSISFSLQDVVDHPFYE